MTVIISRFPLVLMCRYLAPLAATIFFAFKSNCSPVSSIFQICCGGQLAMTPFKAYKYLATFIGFMHWCRTAAVDSGCLSVIFFLWWRLSMHHHLFNGFAFLNLKPCLRANFTA